ncbi:uncharacterized protein LOC112680239 [Sipha flava]|uniref:Uncharacterized protein LOC112680239 n=1 Tax=Sipha flava TaxID=143950 RepID=A0A8B8F609_9HEMI|nr:uncharacterized protein LOC112680239 [Sipha flava]
MMTERADIERVNRVKRKALLKCNNCFNRVKAIHAIALRCVENAELYAQLSVLLDDVDDICNVFKAENETYIDCLVDLELESEYSEDPIIEMYELISFSKAVLNNHEYPRRVMSVHGGSQRSLHSTVINTHNTQPVADDDVCGPARNVIVDAYADNSGPSENSAPITVDRSKSVRLPEIPLPSFHGDIFKWLSFRDRFVAMVDQRQNLTDIEKFYYLTGCLKGIALDAIGGIPVAGDNYQLAWSTLKSRFDRPRLVAASLIENLLTAPKASTETLVDLNKFLMIFDEGVAVLETMKLPNLGDFILFILASRCLPQYSVKLFEAQLSTGFPSVKELLTFVKSRINVLECVPRDNSQKCTNPSATKSFPSNGFKGGFTHTKRFQKTSLVAHTTAPKLPGSCLVCSGSHSVINCRKFLGWSADVRHKWVRDHKMCFRCIRSGHWAQDCKSPTPCDQCPRRHHPLLHPDDTPDVRTSLVGQGSGNSVLLGTTLVHILDCGGVLHTVRALVDSASQISAITSDCSSRLGLRMTRWTTPVSGLAGAPVPNVKGRVNCHVQPRFAVEPIFKFEAWVFPSITVEMPGHPISRHIVEKYKNLALADPLFAVPDKIDLLLGADIFARILDGKRVSVGDSFPVAFGSVFGWIIIGPVPQVNHSTNISCPISLITSVEGLMDKFWQIEEPETAPEDFTHDGQSETIFRDNFRRHENGRFSVPLLFRLPVTEDAFRGSYEVALKRFNSLERKLSADNRLREAYIKFMTEYLTLGHMSPAKSLGTYFIPHHAVYKSFEVETKLRVVFDASAQSFSGTSLNQYLLSGPKLQRDVIDVLTLFRLSRYAFTTDITKMYRQIEVIPGHRCFQHILWRPSPTEELKVFELNTVTYGVNCSPFLALRVLKHIAENDCHDFPAVRESLLFSTYVDDICVGADSVEAAVALQNDLRTVLSRAGMSLKKWASNSEAVLDNVSFDERVTKSLTFNHSEDVGIKVLGLNWSHRDDTFQYLMQSVDLITSKRGMLSLIARIFDPLGLLSPVIFYAKYIMQQVWQSNVDWDDPLPPELSELWRKFVVDLPALQQLKISRFVGTQVGSQCYVCGFCDASERGYAAVVYLKIIDEFGQSVVSLLGAKSKLAPLKATTIPRLELCAAVLLARWLARLTLTLKRRVHVVDIYAWSDSTTVLNWLKVPHENFKIFVSNRIYKIKTLLPKCHWNYIPSAKKPRRLCIARYFSIGAHY